MNISSIGGYGMNRRVHLNINTSLETGHPYLNCGQWVDGWMVNTKHKGSLSITDDINEVTCKVCLQRLSSNMYMQEMPFFDAAP